MEQTEQPSSVFAIANFRAFWVARLASTVAHMILVIVIGWQVYDIARQTMAPREAAFWLGMVGLAQFLPLLTLTFVVGYIADRVDRRYIARLAIGLEVCLALILCYLTATDRLSLPIIFVIAAFIGVGRAFAGPSLQALAPNLVPSALLPSAIAWNAIGWQIGAIGGPPLGGYLYAVNSAAPYGVATLALLIALTALFSISPVPRPKSDSLSPWRATIEGLDYMRKNRIVLGAISLDLFAVLLGGATAMLPIYARDVLHIGAEGLGHLRAAPAVGAAAMAFYLARKPIQNAVGVKMFASVGLFGVATVVFGLSRDLTLSLAALAVLGAADMISVFIRGTLVQLHTPDAMRGRISAVSTLFISASNELGEFESGILGAAIGPVAAVVAGGVGAVIVTLIWAWRFPELRRADRFEQPAELKAAELKESRA